MIQAHAQKLLHPAYLASGGGQHSCLLWLSATILNQNLIF